MTDGGAALEVEAEASQLVTAAGTQTESETGIWIGTVIETGVIASVTPTEIVSENESVIGDAGIEVSPRPGEREETEVEADVGAGVVEVESH